MTDLDFMINAARDSYANHRIVSYERGHWLLKAPDTNVFWVEVVALAGGKLLVHGDTGPVLFGQLSDRFDNFDLYAKGLVRWMGNRKRPDDSYFMEKARIGTETEAALYTPDLGEFQREMESMIAEEEDARLKTELQEILDRVGPHEDEIPKAQEEIYDLLGDPERIPKGRVVSTSVIYAYAALQRLVVLLDAEAS